MTMKMKKEQDPPIFIFQDPRLHMSVVGRMFVRTIGLVVQVVVVVATVNFILSDIAWIKWFGAFLVLFIIDRAMHAGEGDRPLESLRGVSGTVNLAPYLAPKAFGALERAHDRAVVAGDNFFLVLARELLSRADTEECLRRLDVEPKEFQARVEEFIEGEHRTMANDKLLISNNVDKNTDEALTVLIARACDIAQSGGHRFIEPSDIFSALPDAESKAITRLMNIFKITAHDLRASFLFTSVLARAKGASRHHVARIRRHRIMNRAWTARPTPTLDRVSEDFTDLARDGSIGFLVGHEAEYERLVDTLSRGTEPNALLIGDPGIGKETIVGRLAHDITKDKVPEALFDKRLVALHLANLVSGADPAEMHRRLSMILQEIEIAGNIILYIPDIHELVNTSGTAYLSIADALLPVIANNAFPIIGATYPREFKEFIEPRSDFATLFEKIRVEEISSEEAEIILSYDAVALEATTGIKVSFGAVRAAVSIGKKYFHDEPLPSCASELLKETVASAERRGEKAVGPAHVTSTAESEVNVPIHEAGVEEAESLLHLEDTIHKSFIDQHEAVAAVANALREYRSGLARSGGPIASFLFVGPTGVGKTELSKTIATIQFGDISALVRFDMTEYQDAGSISRFIGSSDGKIPGVLTDAIREKPYAVVLLDEFEKAHPDILNLFLQTLDDGRLTDSFGRTVDFQNTIIIATSNVHSDMINTALAEGKSMGDIAEELKRRLTDIFRPELINRFSRVVVFKNLSREDVRSIAELNIAELARTLEKQGITFSASPDAVERVAELGYDPAFGARPLRRVIEERVRALLAEKILKKELVRGSKVVLEAEGAGLRVVSSE
jgi:ATP-dependent Clp protease ATP-binding subunit ClpA